MIQPYRYVIATGPEGSGTHMLADLVAELLGWPQSEPSLAQIQHPEELTRGMVHHISLPSHRPPHWFLTPEKGPPKGSLVLGINRSPLDTLYSVWRRFGTRTPESVNEHGQNLAHALIIMEFWVSTIVDYELLCSRKSEVDRLYEALRIKNPGKPPKLEMINRNGKYRLDDFFMNEVGKS